MRRSFLYGQYFCHSKVLAIATWVSHRVDEDFVTSSSVRSGFTCFSFCQKASDGVKGHWFVFRISGLLTNYFAGDTWQTNL